MTETAERLKLELSQLSIRDRAALAAFLIQSLDEEPEDDVEAAWEETLSRRMAEIENGTASGQPADQVLTQLREKYS
ncbi:addiction module protein [Halomicronema sp. CCY15110]|uniref:addiction module protein n=1 Tax=Halomicronema sp. CCY15110 TaxID=2767773 RepID=UPI001952843C|nr:addiction module protein [Halomicronema sp. CCY15110]